MTVPGLWSVAVLLTLVTLSGGSVAKAQEDCAAAGDFGLGLLEHSCFHTVHGPFAQVTAEQGTEATADTPSVNKVHTNYQVALTPDTVNVVAYTPNRGGSWVLFSDATLPLQLLSADGSELEPLFIKDVAGCEALGRARVFVLEARERYALLLGPSAAPEANLELENVSDFDTLYGQDADGDGYGGTAKTITTPCLPPKGYVAGADDCADDDPKIHPGATERCDEVDRNCNGVPGDGFGVGQECSLGEGACESLAAFECTEDGLSSWCPAAPPGEPTRERCNGVDDDCDGVPDDKEALCEEESLGTRCITEDTGAAHCGCRVDSDCPGDAFCSSESNTCAEVSEGCSCTLLGGSRRGPAAWLPLLVVALLWRRRSR